MTCLLWRGAFMFRSSLRLRMEFCLWGLYRVEIEAALSYYFRTIRVWMDVGWMCFVILYIYNKN